MAERRIYEAPPIREAICEFRFAGTAQWSIRAQLAIAEAVSGDYHGEPELRFQAGFDVAAPTGPVGIHVKEPVLQLQFSNATDTRKLLVGPTSLSVHVHRPYKSWEEYRPFIKSAAEGYQSVFNPTGVARIGLRYINEMTIPQQDVVISEFLNGIPEYAEPLSRIITTGFVARLEGIEPDSQARIIQTIGRSPAADGQIGLVLDIDAIKEWPTDLPTIKDALAHLDGLRDLEREVFESTITDKLRSTFDD